MHIKGFSSGATGQILAHCERLRDDGHYGNTDIDSSRTHLNYSLSTHSGEEAVSFYKSQLKEKKRTTEEATGRKLRKDANTLMGVVVQIPEEYKNESPERQRAFFQTVHNFLVGEFGLPVSAEVHRDERVKDRRTGKPVAGRDHLHFMVIPEKDGKINFTQLINRRYLLTFHDRADEYLKERLSWYKGGLVSEDRQERLKAKDNLAMKDFKAVKQKHDQLEEENRSISSDIARSKQIAEELKARSVSPELVEKVNNGSRLSRAERRELVSLARVGADVVREREELKHIREITDRQSVQLAEAKKEMAEKTKQNEKSYQQAKKAVEALQKEKRDWQIEKATERSKIEADKLSSALLVRDIGDMLEMQGKALFSLCSTSMQQESKPTDYSKSQPVLDHDNKGLEYEKLRERADIILERNREDKCKPFSFIANKLKNLFMKLSTKTYQNEKAARSPHSSRESGLRR